MNYKRGDIVRVNPARRIKGFCEVVDEETNEGYLVTNDECDSEFYFGEKDLLLVCRREDRKDL